MNDTLINAAWIIDGGGGRDVYKCTCPPQETLHQSHLQRGVSSRGPAPANGARAADTQYVLLLRLLLRTMGSILLSIRCQTQCGGSIPLPTSTVVLLPYRVVYMRYMLTLYCLKGLWEGGFNVQHTFCNNPMLLG